MSILTANRGTFSVDETTHTLSFERLVAATPAEVFAAWTVPEQLSRWWDPTGEALAVCEIDLRPGGEFRFAGCHSGDRPFTGVYREIAPPHLLVFEANGATGRVHLAERGIKTLMRVEILCRSAEHLAQFVAVGVAKGTAQTLDNLVGYFER